VVAAVRHFLFLILVWAWLTPARRTPALATAPAQLAATTARTPGNPLVWAPVWVQLAVLAAVILPVLPVVSWYQSQDFDVAVPRTSLLQERQFPEDREVALPERPPVPPPEANAHWFNRAYEIGEEYGLGKVFLRQMMQESGFRDEVIDGRVVSWAGAQGVAQIMPAMHPGVNPLDPEAALQYAARHMASLVIRYQGSVSKALAAYHSGAGNVDFAIEAGGERWREVLDGAGQLYLANIMRPSEGDLPPDWPEFFQRWYPVFEAKDQPS
jgi:soluble lytic murein transglycosylase-like protein